MFTVLPGATVVVRSIVFANVTAAAATIDVSLAPAGATAGDTNRICKGLSLPANSITVIDLAQVLGSGGFISLRQGTASAVTVTVSGDEVT